MKSGRAALLFAGKLVASTPGATGITENCAERIDRHFAQREAQLDGELGDEAFGQLLKRVARRAVKVIVLDSDGLVTADHFDDLHAHMAEVSQRAFGFSTRIC